MANWCENCRFATEGSGCSEGGCMVVMFEQAAQGIPLSSGVTRAAPEAMTPQGLIGFKVGIKEYPPTVLGYIQARAYQGSFSRRGPVIEPQYRWDKRPTDEPILVWDARGNLVELTLWGERKVVGI